MFNQDTMLSSFVLHAVKLGVKSFLLWFPFIRDIVYKYIYKCDYTMILSLWQWKFRVLAHVMFLLSADNTFNSTIESIISLYHHVNIDRRIHERHWTFTNFSVFMNVTTFFYSRSVIITYQDLCFDQPSLQTRTFVSLWFSELSLPRNWLAPSWNE